MTQLLSRRCLGLKFCVLISVFHKPIFRIECPNLKFKFDFDGACISIKIFRYTLLPHHVFRPGFSVFRILDLNLKITVLHAKFCKWCPRISVINNLIDNIKFETRSSVIRDITNSDVRVVH